MVVTLILLRHPVFIEVVVLLLFCFVQIDLERSELCISKDRHLVIVSSHLAELKVSRDLRLAGDDSTLSGNLPAIAATEASVSTVAKGNFYSTVVFISVFDHLTVNTHPCQWKSLPQGTSHVFLNAYAGRYRGQAYSHGPDLPPTPHDRICHEMSY